MDEQMQQALLSQLRDVHLPEAVSWWPPAIGWWLLLALLIGALYFVARTVLKKRRANAYRRLALLELQSQFQAWQSNNQSATYLQAANAILKRCILSLPHGNYRPSLSQSGSRWASVLQSLTNKPLSNTTLNALGELSYQAQPKVDIPQIHSELEQWIRTHQVPSNSTQTERSYA